MLQEVVSDDRGFFLNSAVVFSSTHSRFRSVMGVEKEMASDRDRDDEEDGDKGID
jgi:hypothetical protein